MQTPDLPDDDEWHEIPTIPPVVLGPAIHNLDAEEQLGKMMDDAENEKRIFELDERNHRYNMRQKEISDIQYFIDKYVASGDARDLSRAKACCEILCGQLKIDEIKRSIEAKADRFKKDEKRRKSIFDKRKNNKEINSDG